MYKKVKERMGKKWAFVTLSVLFGSLVGMGGGTLLIARLANTPEEQSVNQRHLYKNEATVKNYDVSYPVFGIGKADRTLYNYVSRQVEAFWKDIGDGQNDPRNFLTIKYTIAHFGGRTATVVFRQQEQYINRPPVSSSVFMSFNLQTGERLTLPGLFRDVKTAEGWTGRILHDYFQHDTATSYTPSELEQYRRFSLNMVRDFFVGDDSIIFYLNPHDLTSGQDIKAIAIKKNLLQSVLLDPIALSDPNKIQISDAGPLDYSIATLPVHETPIDPRRKMLALTFDDGPGPYTAQVLDVLKQSDAHATFFVIGRQVPRYTDVVKRTVTEGNEVGNHTWDHLNLTLLSPQMMSQQVDRTQTIIEQATGGYIPVLLRPPQGAYNSTVTAFAQSHNLTLALWNVDTLDWLNRDADLVYNRIMSAAADGRIILVHDIHPTTVAAVTRVVPELIAQDYQLVTWSDLDRYR